MGLHLPREFQTGLRSPVVARPISHGTNYSFLKKNGISKYLPADFCFCFLPLLYGPDFVKIPAHLHNNFLWFLLANLRWCFGYRD